MFFQILWAICTCILVILYWKVIRPEKRKYDILRGQGVGGEPFVPFIGQLPKLRRYRQNDMVMRFHQDLAEKYGSVFVFCFGPIPRIVIFEPDLLADIFSRNNASNYVKPPILTNVFTPIIGNQSLAILEGPEHQRARHMVNPAFYHKNLTEMISVITREVKKGVTELLSNAAEGGAQQIDLQLRFNALTLNIIASSAFGSSLQRDTTGKEPLSRAFREAFEAIIDRSLLLIGQIPIIAALPICKKDVIDRNTKIVRDLVERIIAERRQGLSSSLSDAPDLLDFLLSAVDENGQPFTDQQVKDNALTFVFAGSETVGNLMSWVFYILLTHPNVFDDCRTEVDRILPNGNEPTYEDLNQLVICEAIIHETLRLYPPAPVLTRYAVCDHTIGSQRQLFIPKGTTVVVSTYLLHRRSDLWPQPEEFDYKRWLRDPKTGMKPKLPHPFAYLPFAAGSRSCVGQNFALLEAKILLAMLVQRCHFELVPGQRIVPEFTVSLWPKYGIWAKVTPRLA